MPKMKIRVHEHISKELEGVTIGDQVWASVDSSSSATWEEAKAIADKVEGWRLPTKEELLHLINSREFTWIADGHDRWLNGRRYASYWSSTPYVGMNKPMAYGMTLSITNKHVHAFPASDTLRVRLIKE